MERLGLEKAFKRSIDSGLIIYLLREIKEKLN
jgi:hypothetical protein